MTSTTDPLLHKNGPPGRGRRFLFFLTVVVALGLAAGAWRLLWPPLPRIAPPAVQLDGVEPRVAKVIEARLDRVRAEPQSGQAWGDLAVILTAHNFLAESAVCFAVAERLEPREPSWPYLDALTLLRMDRSDEAPVALLARASKLCAGDPDIVQVRLAEVLFQQGRPDEAEKQFRLLLDKDPRHPLAHLGLARLAMDRDKTKDALDHLSYCEQSPFTRKAALLLAVQVRRRMDENNSAQEALRQMEAAPDDAPWPDPFLGQVVQATMDHASRLQLIYKWRLEGQTEKAETEIQEIRNDDPAFVDCKDGENLLRHKDAPGAERLLRRAVEEKPDFAEAHFYLGVALLWQKNPSAAADCFRRTLKLQPDHADAYDYLGQALVLQGDSAGALKALQAAARYLPQRADLQRRLGELLAEDGRNTEAVEHLRRALFLDADDHQAKAMIDKLTAENAENAEKRQRN